MNLGLVVGSGDAAVTAVGGGGGSVRAMQQQSPFFVDVESAPHQQPASAASVAPRSNEHLERLRGDLARLRTEAAQQARVHEQRIRAHEEALGWALAPR